MNTLSQVNYYPTLPVRPRVWTSAGERVDPVQAVRSVRPYEWENLFSKKAEDSIGSKRVILDEPRDLPTRRALQAYLEIRLIPDEAQPQLWFKVDVYV